jgi:hypothetical protein
VPSFRASDYEYVELPEDTPLLCEISKPLEVPNKFAGQKNESGRESPETQLQIDLEIVEGEFKGERIRAWFNPVFGPKASLTKLACAAFNREWSKDWELDSDELEGKRVYVLGDYGDDGKANRLRPTKYKPATADAASGRRGRRSEPTTEAKPTEQREPAAAAAATNGKPAATGDDLDF